MLTYKINEDAGYKGCGLAWAIIKTEWIPVVNEDGEEDEECKQTVVKLLYANSKEAKHLDELGREAQQQAVEMGGGLWGCIGMASCYEFCRTSGGLKGIKSEMKKFGIPQGLATYCFDTAERN